MLKMNNLKQAIEKLTKLNLKRRCLRTILGAPVPYRFITTAAQQISKDEIKAPKDTFFVTTPIYYANGEPHIGHLYTSVIADAIHRWRHLIFQGSKSIFSTGTDEHGSKIQEAAKKHNVSAYEYCQEISERYKNLADDFSIDYTDFIQTTDPKHEKRVHDFWNILNQSGHIYSADYEGWYCVSEETFLTSTQLKQVTLNDGSKYLVSEETGHPVEWTKEKNYLFRLSKYQNDLIVWLKSNDHVVQPKKFQKILLDWLTKEPLNDISISRPTSRVKWGIQVPSDPSQTIYVWLDALVSYLTAAKFQEAEFNKFWPPDVQVIGKDILKFHGIYWPAFLMAADLEPPKSIFCHSHWTVSYEKMSKSKHNVVDPFDRINTYTSDGLRYYLLRAGVAGSDGNYNDKKVLRVVNTELADTLGNLLSRCTGANLNPDQVIPAMNNQDFVDIIRSEEAQNLIKNVENLPVKCYEYFTHHQFYKGVDAVVATLHSANLFFETMKPWELKKNAEHDGKLNVVLHLTLETLRVVGILLQPIIPELSTTLLDRLSVDEDARYFKDLSSFSWNNDKFSTKSLSPDGSILFKRVLFESAQVKVRQKYLPRKKN